jgi:hypothetical protein
MKNLVSFLTAVFITLTVFAQSGVSTLSFIEVQRTLPRPGDALKRKEDTLQRQAKAKGFDWPVKSVYIRSFKYDGQLEVWIKNNTKEPYKLFKICVSVVSFIFTFLFLFIISAPVCVSTSRCFEFVVKACGDTSFGVLIY